MVFVHLARANDCATRWMQLRGGCNGRVTDGNYVRPESRIVNVEKKLVTTF